MKLNLLIKVSLLFLITLIYSHPILAQENSDRFINVTAPNGGEQWEANSLKTITWESFNVSKVKIEYSLTNGLDWNPIIDSVDAYLGSFLWTVPDAKTPYVQIRISDASKPQIFDVSDANFDVIIPQKKYLYEPDQVSTATIKIMPLGDSITWGTLGALLGGDTGYRRALDSLLNKAGYNFDFVGSLIGGTPADFDRNNEGRPGWFAGPPTWNQLVNGWKDNIRDTVNTVLGWNPTNVVLLHIGTNDISETYAPAFKPAATVVNLIKGILDSIYVFDPTHNIVTFLAKIVDRKDNETNHLRTDTLNTLLESMISTLPADQEVILVDMYSALGDYWGNPTNPNFSGGADNLHPSTQGYLLMAQTWFNALQEYYQPILALPDSNTIDRGIFDTLKWHAPPVANDMSVTYQVQISTNPLFSSDIVFDSEINDTSVSPYGFLAYSTTYYWRTRVLGYGWSTVWNFTTEANPVTGCPSNMIAYWKLDETIGPLYLDSFDGHSGQTGTDTTTAVTGIVNGAQQFDGTDDEINVPPSSAFDFTSTSSFSIELWIKHFAGVSASNEVIIGRDDASSSLHWWVGLQGDGKAIFYLVSTGGAGHAVMSTSALNDSSWHHIVVVRNGNLNQLKIYIDGVLENSTVASYSTGFSSATANINLGWLNLDAGYHFNGSIDEVAIYVTSLGESVIKQHYKDGLIGLDYCDENDSPIITSSPVIVGTVDQLYSYDVEATGNPTPTYSLETFPSGMTINSSTGLIDWTPSSSGIEHVKVKVSNTINAQAVSDSQEFDIDVQDVVTCPSNMIAYWKLNESSGPNYDDYYDGHTGQAGADAPTAIAGIIDGAQQFDGNNDEINVSPNSAFDFTSTSSFSISLWAKRSAGISSNEVIIGRDDASTSLHWWIGLNGSGQATFYLISITGELHSLTGTSKLDNGTWHNIVAVRDGSLNQLKIYVNGVLENSTTATYDNGFASATANINIGWLNLDAGYHYNGLIDEVAIYDTALGISDIQPNYVKGMFGKGYCEPYTLLSSKIFLDGPYSSGSMDTNLTSVLPLSHPYGGSPWNYSGSEAVPPGYFVSHTNIVDWVLVQLRTGTDSATTVNTRAGFLVSNGTIVDIDGSSPLFFAGVGTGNYHIVVRHRNHLAVMSSSTDSLLNPPTVTSYDFTTGSSQFYGTGGAKEVGTGVWGMIAGDANGDGKVKYNGAANDKNSILAEVGLLTPNNVVSGYSNNDVNMDGLVKYNGASNDKNTILGVVGLTTPNNVIQTQVP